MSVDGDDLCIAVGLEKKTKHNINIKFQNSFVNMIRTLPVVLYTSQFCFEINHTFLKEATMLCFEIIKNNNKI